MLPAIFLHEPLRTMTDSTMLPTDSLGRARSLARLLDKSFRIPGTSFKFGLDPILGLLPVGGDVLAALASGYIVLVGWRLGAPREILTRMTLNVVLDLVAGSVPVIGDAFDAFWKANTRNVRLLEEWLEETPQAA